jgi:hypothetical protein
MDMQGDLADLIVVIAYNLWVRPLMFGRELGDVVSLVIVASA